MPSFQHRHYEAIASVMKHTKPGAWDKDSACYLQWSYTVAELAVLFLTANPGFKPTQFFVACGQEPQPLEKMLHDLESV